MDGNYHVNEKENNSPSERRGRTISDVRGPLNGQLSIGRRVLATRKDVGIGRNSPSTTKRKQINGRQNKQVSLKDGNGLVVGKGILFLKYRLGTMWQGLFYFHIRSPFVFKKFVEVVMNNIMTMANYSGTASDRQCDGLELQYT